VTLQLNVEENGLFYQVDVPMCRDDVLELVQRKDIQNRSFAILCYEDSWDRTGGYPLRHLLSGRLIDVAPVATPAYPDATFGLRSLAAHVGAPLRMCCDMSKPDELRKLLGRTDR
jgi:phage head maturation protease